VLQETRTLGRCYSSAMESLDREIIEAIEPLPAVSALVVFGSRARGTSRPDSDLDVAILPASPDSSERRHLQARAAAALAHLAPEGKVDVVILDEATDVLRQRILSQGRLLLCQDPEAWRELRVQTMREYGDREWVRRIYQEAQHRRLTGGLPSGRSPRALASLKRFRGIPR
jgi:predicted nucleotidyltransferase